MSSSIPTVRFHSTSLPRRRQFESWRQAVVGFDVSRPDLPAEEPFAAEVEAFSLKEFALVVSQLGGSSEFAGPQKDQPHNLSIVLLRDGSLAGAVEGRAVVAERGQIMLFDWERDAKVVLSPSSTLVLIAPWPVLGPSLSFLPDLHGRLLDGAAGRLLTEFLLLLPNQLRAADPAGHDLLATATREVVLACLGALPRCTSAADPVHGSAIRAQACAIVEAHLGDGDFGPGRLSQLLGVTRSTLYRAFSASGGVACHIQRRRLEAAHAALADTADLRSVKSIALAHGYRSVPHFNATFRRTYGYPPMNVRKSATRPRPAAPLSGTPEAQLFELVSRLNG